MNHTYIFTFRLLLISALCVTSYSVAAENNFESIYYNDAEIVVEPNIQLNFLPGINRHQKQSLVMHMVEHNNHDTNILNLNSSLVETEPSLDRNKYFDDIEVVNNNLFELRF